MRSWGGTSRVTVLNSTLTILSTTGIRMKRPGPLARPCTLPSLKMTPRSYSLTILTALVRINKITATTATSTMAANPIATDCNKPRLVFMRDTPFASSLGVEDGATAGPLGGHHLHRSPSTINQIERIASATELAECEAISFHPRIEKFDLELAIIDGFGLSDQLIEPLLADRAVALLVNLSSVSCARHLSIYEHAKRHRLTSLGRSHHEVNVARMEANRNPSWRLA